METRFNVKSKSNGGHQQFPASTFPETFKDFFSMDNEDEDHIELVSNVLEDKVIPRYNVRGRNRSSSAKYSNTTSLLPTANTQVRSNSFRVNRNSGRNATGAAAGTVTPDFCKHIKYCCLHQNLTNASARLDSDKIMLDRNRSQPDHNLADEFSENRAINTTKFTFDDMNANTNSTNFNNYSDDEKSLKLTRKFSVDASINLNIHNKSLQHSYDSFETRKCNCENCSASDFNNCSGDELISKLKATNSSYCLMRHNRSINQLRSSGNERSSSGASNVTFNFSTNSSSTMQDKSTTDSTIISTTSTASSNRKQMELNRQKSPVLNRRRASSITLARTIPNFSSPQAQIVTSPAHNPNELYRYMKSDEPQVNWGQQQQQLGEQQTSASLGNSRLENREKYTRSKSPNMFNRKAVETLSTAVNKNQPGQSKPQQQRARTASMPAENRKPRLADTRRSAIHGADIDMEYYRLRSFSITSHGICNLGDSMRSRRSRSINSVTSSNSGRDRNNSTGSQHMEDIKELANAKDDKNISYKVAMLGDSAVGKSSLTYQFTTSEYICAYDLSLDDDYGQKTVSVLLNNQETDLEIIDHPACEMSVEAFCSTYSIDLFVIVYSIVDRKTFKTAERILLYLKENEMMLTRGAILVGNKTDLERQREVSTQAGRKLAKEIGCKFIEASSGLNHNVDELLVGIVAQVKLNPQRISNLTEKQRNSLGMVMQQKYKGTTTQDHFSELRRNERNKSNNSKKGGSSSASGGTVIGKNNKENVTDDFEDESDDERSSDEEDNSDIEKYFNMDEKVSSTSQQQQQQQGEGSMTANYSRMLKSRRYATPGMGHGIHYGIINSFFNNDSDREINNSNNNISSSSCSTPTTAPQSSSSNAYNNKSKNQTKTNKRDLTSYEPNKHNNPSSSSQPATPKKSNLSGTDSDTNERCINKFSNRTKMFLTSFLKFKRSLRVKRRNSNSCSDLFVI